MYVLLYSTYLCINSAKLGAYLKRRQVCYCLKFQAPRIRAEAQSSPKIRQICQAWRRDSKLATARKRLDMPSRYRNDRKLAQQAHDQDPDLPVPPVVGDNIPSPAGPHPSFIQVANPYIFEATVKECLESVGTNQSREDNMRIQGVTWLDNVRKALQLYVFNANHRPF